MENSKCQKAGVSHSAAVAARKTVGPQTFVVTSCVDDSVHGLGWAERCALVQVVVRSSPTFLPSWTYALKRVKYREQSADRVLPS